MVRFQVFDEVAEIRDKVKLFQKRALTDVPSSWSLTTDAAAHLLGDLDKAPVNPSVLLNPRRHGDAQTTCGQLSIVSKRT
jgi:hypothetical protein